MEKRINRGINNRRFGVINIPFFFLGCLIILTYFYLIATIMPSLVQIPFFFLWILATAKDGKMWSKAINLSLVGILMFLFSFIRCAIAGQLNMEYYSTFQSVIQRYQLMVFTMVYIYVADLERDKKKKVFKLSAFSIFVTCVFSLFYVFFVDPQAIRNTQRDYLWGVGDFVLMYAMAIFSGPLLHLIMEKRKRHEKVLNYVILLGTMLLTIIMCNLVTSVVVAAISIVLTYCISRKQKVLYIIFSAVGVLLLSLRKVFGELLYSLADKRIFYWSTNNKIIAIANILSGVADKTNVDTITRRFMLAGFSLNSFKNNPIFGINWKDSKYGTIGGHMQWADDLGRYGIVGALICIPYYIYLCHYTSNYNKSTIVHDSMLSAWLVFFILGFLNPNLSGTILMIIFVVIPTFDSLIGDNDEAKNSFSS